MANFMLVTQGDEKQIGIPTSVGDMRLYPDAGFEAQLQHLLFEYPHIIPVEELWGEEERLIPLAMEFPVRGGSIDLLFVTTQGKLVLVEVKRAESYEARRKIIGQLFDYAASLWQMPASEFDAKLREKMHSKFEVREQLTLGNALEKLVEMHGSEWMVELQTSGLELERNIHRSRDDGDFYLVVALDGYEPHLMRILRYLAMRDTRVYGIVAEGCTYGSEGIRSIVVHAVVTPERERKGKPETFITSVSEWLQYLESQGHPAIKAIKRLMEQELPSIGAYVALPDDLSELERKGFEFKFSRRFKFLKVLVEVTPKQLIEVAQIGERVFAVITFWLARMGVPRDILNQYRAQMRRASLQTTEGIELFRDGIAWLVSQLRQWRGDITATGESAE